MLNELNLLQSKRFLPLFITQFLGAFNDNVYKNALVILITYRLAENMLINSQLLVTFAAGTFILPFFLFSATAGQLADKYEKSSLIVKIKWVEVILMGLVCIALYMQQITMLLILLFLIGVQATFFGPLKYAILPEHLKKEELVAGNALIEAGTFLSILLGTILGGVLILLPYGDFLISFMVMLIALGGVCSSYFIPSSHLSNLSFSHPVNINILKSTYDIIAYSFRDKRLFIIILAISWFWLVGAVFLAEFPVFTRDDLYANQSVVTFFFTLFSIGIGIGSLSCNLLLKNKIRTTYVPIAAWGITLFTIDLYFAAGNYSLIEKINFINLGQFLSSFNGWRITIDLLLVAVCGGLYIVPLYVLLQTLSEEIYRARVIASNNIINAFFMTLAAIITMLMLKYQFTVREVFLSLAIANSMIAVLMMVYKFKK
jgi:acyl-[acyl-carrier-protein]-phospholipid O-acyltransferase/long-chain-fatty-acid--[acyl-carrier-protein] ligase